MCKSLGWDSSNNRNYCTIRINFESFVNTTQSSNPCNRGSQFSSNLFLELSKIIGFHRLITTYHLKYNGGEGAYRTTAIVVCKESWFLLPNVLLSTSNESGLSFL